MKAKKPSAAKKLGKKPGKKKVGDMGMGGPLSGMFSRPTGAMPGSRPTGGTPTTTRPPGPTPGTKFSPPQAATAMNPGYGPPKRNDVLFNRRHPKPGTKIT